MKEIVVISGKGGTGKTSITASFAYLGGKDVVVADCDVDAADMHLLMKPGFSKSEDFYSGEKAFINQKKCTQCGKCKEICRFNAISIINEEYYVHQMECEGCGYCAQICSENAISMKEQNVGKCYISNTRMKNEMVHAKLNIGAENSGKLVAKVKNEAKRIAEETNKKLVIVDGAPGIGCPVISSLSGADLVVLVTEPTISGFHDLKRVYGLVEKFQIQAVCIINRADLNETFSNKILEFLNKKNIILITTIPYDDSFTMAMTIGKTIVEYSSNIKKLLDKSWNQIKQIL